MKIKLNYILITMANIQNPGSTNCGCGGRAPVPARCCWSASNWDAILGDRLLVYYQLNKVVLYDTIISSLITRSVSPTHMETRVRLKTCM